MRELLDTLDGWTAEGHAVGRAVVVRTFGSAPRPEGAVLIRADDGRIAGSVSGGCVEGAAAGEIERARADGHSRGIRYRISDEEAWDGGLACGGAIGTVPGPAGAPPPPPGPPRAGGAVGRAWGGTMDVLVDRAVPAAAVAAARERGVAVATVLPPDAPPSAFGRHEPGDGARPEPPVVVRADGTLDGTLGSPDED